MADPVCDICCRPRSRHKGRDLQCTETTYFREMQPAAVTPPTLTEGAEIVERLLAKRERFVSRAAFKGVEEYHVNPDGPEAATHIITQEAELTRLRQRVAELETGREVKRYPADPVTVDSEIEARASEWLARHQPNGGGAS